MLDQKLAKALRTTRPEKRNLRARASPAALTEDVKLEARIMRAMNA